MNSKRIPPPRRLLLVALGTLAVSLLVVAAFLPSGEPEAPDSPLSVLEQKARQVEWEEYRPDGTARFRVRAAAAVQHGARAEADSVVGRFFDAAGTRPIRVEAPSAVVRLSRGGLTAETIVFHGPVRVLLPGGEVVRTQGVRWSRSEGTIRSDETVRLEGRERGWIEGARLVAWPESGAVVLPGARGAWPFAVR